MNKETDCIGIVLLAAGNSKRFGGRKQFYPIHGKMMYLHIVDQLKQLSNTNKVLVTQFEEMKEQIDDFQIIMNHQPEEGISRSIHLGIDALIQEKKSLSGVMFAVCDQPYLRMESLKCLVEQYKKSTKKIACLSFQGKMGNPVIFHPDYLEELQELSGDVGGKVIVKRHMEEVLLVEVKEQRELFDIDKKQDIEKE